MRFPSLDFLSFTNRALLVPAASFLNVFSTIL